MEKNYKEYLNHVDTFIFDVDGVLTDGSIQVSTQGELLRTMNIKDGYALKTANQAGFHVCIISGGNNEGVRKRLRDLGITNIFLGVQDKVECLKEYFDIYGIESGTVLYMGDDIPDLYAMRLVGMPCCPQDAVAEIKEISRYVSHRKGGQGCVRGVIDQGLQVQGKWLLNPDAL